MKKVLYICLLFVLPLATGAQTVLGSLDEALSYARLHNRELISAKLNQLITEENRNSARAALLPVIKGSGTADDYFSLPTQLLPAEFLGGIPGEYRKIQFGTKYNINGNIDANLPVINTSYWNNFKAAGLQSDMAKAQTLSREQDLTDRIAKVYYATLLSQEAVGLAQKNVSISDSLLETATQRFKNGVIEPLELNRTKASLLNSLTSLEENKLILKKNTNSLKQLLGMEAGMQLSLGTKLASKEATPSLPNFLPEKYPLYKAKLINLDIMSLNLRTEQQKRIPELSIYSRYNRQLQTQNLDNFTDKTWFTTGYAGIKLDLPIFTGFARTAAIAKASLNRKLAQNELEDYLSQAKIQDEELVSNYEKSLQAYKNSTEALALLEENYKTAQFKYNNGVYSYDQLTNIYNELLSGQNQYLSRLADFMSYKSGIETRNKFSN